MAIQQKTLHGHTTCPKCGNPLSYSNSNPFEKMLVCVSCKSEFTVDGFEIKTAGQIEAEKRFSLAIKKRRDSEWKEFLQEIANDLRPKSESDVIIKHAHTMYLNCLTLIEEKAEEKGFFKED